MDKFLSYTSAIPRRIVGRVRYIFRTSIMPVLLAWKVLVCFPWRRHGYKHGLGVPLIVSLTSYPARFNTLPLTLKCLLSQRMAADRVILWIAHQDKPALTPGILELQKAGLEIGYCDDLRSYKKIIPTLQKHPDAYIVTADDDVYYWPTWLQELVQVSKNNPHAVACHRSHTIRLGADGLPLPYAQWQFDSQSYDLSPLTFQTGIGGVLYPPGVFHKDVNRIEVFKELCFQADDVWLYWMMRLNGVSARRVPLMNHLYCWPSSQETALWCSNVIQGGNDLQIRKMIENYGSVF